MRAILQMYARVLDELRQLKQIVENPNRRAWFHCVGCGEKCTILPDETIANGTVIICRCGAHIKFTLETTDEPIE